MTWQRVIFAADCDEDGCCPECGIDYAECSCPGPTMDEYEYCEIEGVLYARLINGGLTDQDIADAIVIMRQRASRAWGQHALWELIFDAEAILKGERTILSRAEIEEVIEEVLQVK